jgi:enoyl-CoA hydratase
MMIDVADQAGIALVRLNHGKVNALDVELVQALPVAMEQAAQASAVVLTGAGRAFSAGVDLVRIVDGGPDYLREFLPALSKAFLAVFDCPRPVVAAINGHAIAGGCVIAAACDERLMSGGTIGLAELSVGVPFPTSAIEIMRHVLGQQTARLVLSGELLRPSAAELIGLVEVIEAPESLVTRALERASALSRIPADVFAYSKHQLHEQASSRVLALGPEADDRVLELWCSGPVQSAIASYLQQLRSRPLPGAEVANPDGATRSAGS